MKNSSGIIQRKSALTAGISLLLRAVIAAMTYGYLYGNLIVLDAAEATLLKIQKSKGLF